MYSLFHNGKCLGFPKPKIEDLYHEYGRIKLFQPWLLNEQEPIHVVRISQKGE